MSNEQEQPQPDATPESLSALESASGIHFEEIGPHVTQIWLDGEKVNSLIAPHIEAMQRAKQHRKQQLAIVLNDWYENWREEFLIFDEEQTIFELQQAGMPSFPVRRERRLFFTLMQPLTPVQRKWLEEKKTDGLFADFYVKDETSTESER